MLDSVEDEDWEHGRIFHPSNSFNASLQRGQDLFGLPLVGDAGENVRRNCRCCSFDKSSSTLHFTSFDHFASDALIFLVTKGQ